MTVWFWITEGYVAFKQNQLATKGLSRRMFTGGLKTCAHKKTNWFKNSLSALLCSFKGRRSDSF